MLHKVAKEEALGGGVGGSGLFGPKEHLNTRLLQTIVSGIPLVLGLGARMWGPHVYVFFLGDFLLLTKNLHK